jgi:hypothetical protein
MKEEHGLELERIKAEQKLGEFEEAAAMGGGKVYPLPPEGTERTFSFRRLYSAVRDLNETIKNWRGV